jgi:Ice-binding-like
MGVCTGSIDAGNTAACNAEAACLTAYNAAEALVPTSTLSTDLGGLTLPPGVYTFTTLNAALSTTLTLNGTSNTKGQFIFQIKTTFTTSATTAKVSLIGGAQACNVSLTLSGLYLFSHNFISLRRNVLLKYFLRYAALDSSQLPNITIKGNTDLKFRVLGLLPRWLLGYHCRRVADAGKYFGVYFYFCACWREQQGDSLCSEWRDLVD